MAKSNNQQQIIALLQRIESPSEKKQVESLFTAIFDQQQAACEHNAYLRDVQHRISKYRETKNFAYLLGIPFDLTQIPNSTMPLTEYFVLLQTRENFLSQEQEPNWRANLNKVIPSLIKNGNPVRSFFITLSKKSSENIPLLAQTLQNDPKCQNALASESKQFLTSIKICSENGDADALKILLALHKYVRWFGVRADEPWEL